MWPKPLKACRRELVSTFPFTFHMHKFACLLAYWACVGHGGYGSRVHTSLWPLGKNLVGSKAPEQVKDTVHEHGSDELGEKTVSGPARELAALQQENGELKLELERLRTLLTKIEDQQQQPGSAFVQPHVSDTESAMFNIDASKARYLKVGLVGLAMASALVWLAWRARTQAPLSTASSADNKPTAVHGLIFANIAIFVADKWLHISFFSRLYLEHGRWAWWQPLTSCFCHGSRAHLSGNMFLLLLFGRSIEDELGCSGLLFSYAFCGIVANHVSLLLLPSNTVSLGASGAVFGLFAVSTLAKLSWQGLDWRKVVEVAVLGEFVVGKITSEIATTATGGEAGINHVAHLSGAFAGVAMVYLLRSAFVQTEAGTKKLPYET